MTGDDDDVNATSDLDTISVLIATDNHLGYAEKDVLRANDSFSTFEEILRIAKERQVDCMLLGGDLFHENKPSRRTLHRTLELLRHYCMGSKPCALELQSDPAVNFSTKFGVVNYEDPNYNVALPVFAIHGNHDDPTGEGNLSSIDLLATAGLLNYFGKTTTVDDITLTPILLRKGKTKFALYGLGAVRDERLHRTFLQKKVTMLRPPAAEEYYSMLILHQNRVAHGPTNYIPEHFLDEFLDLVVWGHEHECLACDPTVCESRGFTVCQPGSSVATSLSEGETRSKHVVILKVKGREMRMIPVPLKSVRPFLMRDVILRDAMPKIGVHDTKLINEYLCEQVETMIAAAKNDWNERQNALPEEQRSEFPLPLIRLRVDYAADMDGEGFSSAYAVMNPHRFGQQFANRIANPRDAIYFSQRRIAARQQLSKRTSSIEPKLAEERGHTMRVEDLVSHFLTSQRLDLLPQNEFCDAVRLAVEKDDREVIETFVKQSLDRTLATVKGTVLEKGELLGEFEKSRKLREDEWMRMHPGMEALLAMHYRKGSDQKINEIGEGKESERENEFKEDSDQDNERTSQRPISSSRGRGRGRGVTTSLTKTTRTRKLASEKSIDLPISSSKRSAMSARLEFTAIDQSSESNDVMKAIPPTPPQANSVDKSSSRTAWRLHR